MLYVGGAFTDAGGDPSGDYLAQWSGGAWKKAASTPLTGAVNAIAFRNGKLYVGGVFTNAGRQPQRRLPRSLGRQDVGNGCCNRRGARRERLRA